MIASIAAILISWPVAGLRPWRFFGAGFDTNSQLHQPRRFYLLCVGELFEHDLLKRGERSLRVGVLSSARSATALASFGSE